jgi:hypothetical protein
VGFVVDKVALGQVFSEHFGFPCQSSFHQFLHNDTITYHPGLVQQASSGRSTQSPTAQIKKKIKHPLRREDGFVSYEYVSISKIAEKEIYFLRETLITVTQNKL